MYLLMRIVNITCHFRQDPKGRRARGSNVVMYPSLRFNRDMTLFFCSPDERAVPGTGAVELGFASVEVNSVGRRRLDSAVCPFLSHDLPLPLFLWCMPHTATAFAFSLPSSTNALGYETSA